MIKAAELYHSTRKRLKKREKKGLTLKNFNCKHQALVSFFFLFSFFGGGGGEGGNGVGYKFTVTFDCRLHGLLAFIFVMTNLGGYLQLVSLSPYNLKGENVSCNIKSSRSVSG